MMEPVRSSAAVCVFLRGSRITGILEAEKTEAGAVNSGP